MIPTRLPGIYKSVFEFNYSFFYFLIEQQTRDWGADGFNAGVLKYVKNIFKLETENTTDLIY